MQNISGDDASLDVAPTLYSGGRENQLLRYGALPSGFFLYSAQILLARIRSVSICSFFFLRASILYQHNFCKVFEQHLGFPSSTI